MQSMTRLSMQLTKVRTLLCCDLSEGATITCHCFTALHYTTSPCTPYGDTSDHYEMSLATVDSLPKHLLADTLLFSRGGLEAAKAVRFLCGRLETNGLAAELILSFWNGIRNINESTSSGGLVTIDKYNTARDAVQMLQLLARHCPADCLGKLDLLWQALAVEVRKNPMASYSTDFGVKLEQNVEGGLVLRAGKSERQAIVVAWRQPHLVYPICTVEAIQADHSFVRAQTAIQEFGLTKQTLASMRSKAKVNGTRLCYSLTSVIKQARMQKDFLM